MKVTIDTKEDSMDDIKKVVHLLTHILERKGESVNLESNTPVDTTNMMSMFSDEPVEPKKDIPDNLRLILNRYQNTFY